LRLGPAAHSSPLLDFRVARDIPIYEKPHLQLIAEAFNLANHTIVIGVNSTYSQYSAISGSSSAACQTAAPAGSVLQGCITPYSGTGTSAFGATSSTTNTLYGPRQLQFQARMSF
jgi:hypothetical protein